MKKEKGLGLIGVLLIIGILLLTAGGVVVWERKTAPKPTLTSTSPTTKPVGPTVGGPVSPGIFEGDLRDLPTTAPTIITPFPESSDEIVLTLAKFQYSKGETIEVRIKNNSSHQLGYYNCPGGLVRFERRVNQTWQLEISLAGDDYGSKRPCYPLFLEAGQELLISKRISTQVPSGTYRAVFQYIDGTVYSNESQIL